MHPPRHLVAALAVVLLGTGACATAHDAASPPAPATASPTPTTDTTGALPQGLRERPAVAAAIADTARRAGVAPDEVVLVRWGPVTWSDGSLGCPKEGVSYPQVLVEGELLVLRVGSEPFHYHARADGPFGYCAEPSAPTGVG